MMNDFEEDFADFPAEDKQGKPAESTVGAYRAASTDSYPAGSGIII